MTVIVPTARGLYCQAGDFYIDPSEPVRTAVITHGHGDHLRPGSTRYLLASAGASIAQQRLGRLHTLAPLEYGAPVRLGAARVSLHPAGHVLGSAQVRVEAQGEVWVVSGDYKRVPDPTCAAFEPLECDVFISEATFAHPDFRWSATHQVIDEIRAWWRANRARGIASVLFCYALGKAQRVLAELAGAEEGPIHAHPRVELINGLYRRAGVHLAPTLFAPPRGDYRGALVIAPPGVAGTPWMRRCGAHERGCCSGWMLEHARRERYDRGFVLSDHADWPALLATCTGSGARRVLVMHGEGEPLVRHLCAQGVDAQTFAST